MLRFFIWSRLDNNLRIVLYESHCHWFDINNFNINEVCALRYGLILFRIDWHEGWRWDVSMSWSVSYCEVIVMWSTKVQNWSHLWNVYVGLRAYRGDREEMFISTLKSPAKKNDIDSARGQPEFLMSRWFESSGRWPVLRLRLRVDENRY